MILPSVSELLFLGVTDPGVANQERLNIRVTEQLNLASYGVLVGLSLADGTAMPMWDHFFWFGAMEVPANSWIVLFTGPGKFGIDRDSRTGEAVYTFHWGKTNVLFPSTNIVPLLFQIGAFTVGKNAGAPHKEVPPAPKEPPPLIEALLSENASAPTPSSGSLGEILGITKRPSPNTSSVQQPGSNSRNKK